MASLSTWAAFRSTGDWWKCSVVINNKHNLAFKELWSFGALWCFLFSTDGTWHYNWDFFIRPVSHINKLVILLKIMQNTHTLSLSKSSNYTQFLKTCNFFFWPLRGAITIDFHYDGVEVHLAMLFNNIGETCMMHNFWMLVLFCK